MKMLKLERFNVQELAAHEMMKTDGGTLPYAEYSWSGTTNSIVYAVEAGANGVKLVYNGVAAAWNWATS